MLVSPGELELVRFTTMPCQGYVSPGESHLVSWSWSGLPLCHVKVMLVSPGELELVRFTTMPCQGYASLTW